jgi:alpha-amylase
MYEIKNRYAQEEPDFKDIDALGVFVDNHDNARFLNGNGNHQLFKSALMFAITSRGVPFTYYGSEQGFSGGNDPHNREVLWNNMDTTAEIYTFLAKVNAARQKVQPWNSEQAEKYVMDDFYAFSKGPMLVALTNQVNNSVNYVVPNAPFSEGDTVCNIFYPTTDCQQVKNGSVNVYLDSGEQKMYVEKSLALEIEGEVKEVVSKMFLQQ